MLSFEIVLVFRSIKVQGALTMSDNNYWAVGEYTGKAWGIGRNFAPGE